MRLNMDGEKTKEYKDVDILAICFIVFSFLVGLLAGRVLFGG